MRRQRSLMQTKTRTETLLEDLDWSIWTNGGLSSLFVRAVSIELSSVNFRMHPELNESARPTANRIVSLACRSLQVFLYY